MSLAVNGSFVFSYKSKASLSNVISNSIPSALRDWLYAKDVQGAFVRAFSRLAVSLGPGNGSFWATDGTSYKWKNLPAGLQKAVDGLLTNGVWSDNPRCTKYTEVNWVFWRLNNYKELDGLFDMFNKQSKLSLIHKFSLSPHQADACALLLETGTLAWEGTPASAKEGLDNMEKAFKEDVAEADRARALENMRNSQRAIELNMMAARQANQAAAFMMSQAAYLGGYGYGRRSCGHPDPRIQLIDTYHLFIPTTDSSTHDLLPDLARACEFIEAQPQAASCCEKGVPRFVVQWWCVR
ncbi:MAG: hypothetical protein M1829_001554 [Trizodia sp. TS-e1964]|nr:MAG: hypothetical protein M1829_001554 [Trizodia sp. TS-e1964]